MDIVVMEYVFRKFEAQLMADGIANHTSDLSVNIIKISARGSLYIEAATG